VEQDPKSWWWAATQVIRKISEQLSAQELKVEGIGLTGQMHGPVLLNQKGELLGPCMLWMDTRAEAQAAALTSSIGEERLLTLTGNPAVAAFPAAKLLWLRQHRPEVHRAIRMVLMPKDYIGFCLTGQYATDPSDASGTLLFDLRTGRWSEALIEAVGLPLEALPKVLPSSLALLGNVAEAAAQQTGLRAGTPVFVGAGDLATAALGNGLVQPGRVAITLGTAGQLLFYLERWPESLLGKFYFFVHAIPGTYLGLGTIPTGGAALQWLGCLLTDEEQPDEGFLTKLARQAERVPPGAKGLIFLPYLAGTGTPYLDYQARGAFIGLTEAHGPGELARALLEGVAYALYDSLQLLQAEGFALREIRIAGGGLKVPPWPQIQANIYQHPLRPVRTLDASPFGACLLAAVGSGYYRDLVEACESVVAVDEPITPEVASSEHYRRGYEIFRQLYVQLQEIFRALHHWAVEGERDEARGEAHRDPGGSSHLS
jgi:xylulokinase